MSFHSSVIMWLTKKAWANEKKRKKRKKKGERWQVTDMQITPENERQHDSSLHCYGAQHTRPIVRDKYLARVTSPAR